MKNDTKSKQLNKNGKRGGKRPGAGRPPVGEDSTKLQVYVPGAVAERLEAQAVSAGIRLTEHVRLILERAAAH